MQQAAPPQNPDARYYVNAARTFREAGTFRNPMGESAFVEEIIGKSGDYFASFPPLFPLLLSLFEDGVFGARMVNALCLAVTSILVVSIVYAQSGEVLFALVGLLILWWYSLTQTPIWAAALSEPLFIVLSLVWIRLIARSSSEWLLGLVTGLLILTRYAGLIFVPVGLLIMFLMRRGTGAFLFTTLGVCAWWFLRNLALGLEIMGTRTEPIYNPLEIVISLVIVVVGWCVPAICVVGVRHIVSRLRHLEPRSFTAH